MILNNTKNNKFINVTIEKGDKRKSIIIDNNTVMKFLTPDITKNYKVVVPKYFNMDRKDYFIFINYLAKSINEYKIILDEMK